MRLRSVELRMPGRATASAFLLEPWRLAAAGTQGATSYFRGSGDQPYILSVTEAAEPSVAAITFSGSEAEVETVYRRVVDRGAPHTEPVTAFDEPGATGGFTVQGPEFQSFRFVAETPPLAPLDDADRPVGLTHVVLNARDVGASERFAVDVLGFRVSDRTRMMHFVRCNAKHHAIAFAHADVASLNHIAFEMTDLDAVMRGIGRLKDAGYEPIWGPGRHGPGNNVFGYFIAPFGTVVEYTAEVAEVGEDYRVGRPEDWNWPPNRVDQWGLSKKDTAKASVAERTFRFRARLA